MNLKLMTFVQFILAINYFLVSLVNSQTINQQNSPCPFAIKINTNHLYRGSLHFICLQSTGSYPTLDIIQFLPQQLIARVQVDDLGTNQMASFVDDEGILRILLAVPSRRNGTSVYSFDKKGQILGETHTINTQFVSSMNIWRLELDLQWKLAIANQPTYEQHILDRVSPLKLTPPDPKPMITIHSWRYTYFDSDQLIQLPHDGLVNKIEPININGQEFMVIAMNSHPFQSAPIHSLIYKLDFGDGTLMWKLFQSLNLKYAFDVKSFTMMHQDSLQKEYYFALLGSTTTAPSTNPVDATGNDEDCGLKIFKYFGNQFIAILSYSLPDATALDTISYGTGDTYVMIALLSDMSKQISLFRFDGLSLKPITGPQISKNPINLQANRTLHTRTNEPLGFHLFLPPINSTSTSKRTLDVTHQQGAPLPVLVISQLQKNPQTFPTATNEVIQNEVIGSLYHLSTDELLDGDQLALTSRTSSSPGYFKRNLVMDVSASLLNWCHTTIERLVRDNFNQLSIQLMSLPKVDQIIPIEIYNDLLIDNDLYISNLLYTSNIIDSSGAIIPETSILNSSYTFNEINEVHSEIDAMKQVVDHILVDDGTSQDVYNTVTFENLIIYCLNSAKYDSRIPLTMQAFSLSCPYVNEIQTNILNSRNVTDLENQAKLAGRSMVITSDVRFEHLVLRGQVDIIDTLNGLSIDDIVFKRGSSKTTISGHKRFLTPLFTSSRLSVREWNGIGEISRQNFLTSSGYQRIDSHNLVGRIIVDSTNALNSDSFIANINNIHLETHLNQISISNEVNQIYVPLFCDEIVLNGPSEFVNSNQIAGIDIQELWSKTMFKMSNQDVFVPMSFDGLVRISYGGDTEIHGKINGISLKTYSVLTRNLNYTFPNPIVFEQDLNVKALHLEKTINEIPVIMNVYTRSLELPIMYSGIQQVLDGYKILNTIALAGYSSITGKINGNLNLTNFRSLMDNRVSYRFSTIYIDGILIKAAKQTHIEIETIDGIDSGRICDLASLASNSSKFNFYNRLRAEQPIHFKKLNCGSINGFGNLSKTFLTRYGNQHLQGTLKLSSGVIFNTTINIHSTLNSINTRPLAGAIAKTVNETRYRDRDLDKDLIVEDLIVDRVNNLTLSSIFLSKSDLPQLIQAQMTFDYLDIENVLRVERNFITSLFNDINTLDLLSNTLQYDKPQIIHNHIQLNNLHLLADSNFVINTLNGIDIQHLFNDAVFIQIPQQILALKTFSNQVDLNSRLSLAYDVDGLTSDELKLNFLLQTDELIEGDLEFYPQVIVKKELEVLTGLINDIDINLFIGSLLYENQKDNKGMRVVGNGSVTFRDVKLNNLVIGGTIQGIDLSKEALTRDDNLNGTYNSKIRDQQTFLNNQRLLDSLYGSETQIRVRSQYRGIEHTGSCFIHSCSRASLKQASWFPVTKTKPTLINLPILWQPNWYAQAVSNLTNVLIEQPNLYDNSMSFGIPNHKESAKVRAIRDLSFRVNKHLSVSFHYEIVQKHPLLGPLLHAGKNPNLNGNDGSFLFLKATGKPGEPCLRRGQSIAVMSQQRQRNAATVFTQNSRIQDSSDPIMVKSLVVNSNHYLFVLDNPIETIYRYSSLVAIYFWDHQLGLYNLKQKVPIDGFPTSMKAFTINDNACFAIVNPKVQMHNLSGAAALYCQNSTLSEFDLAFVLPFAAVFDLDLFTMQKNGYVLFATLSLQDTEQVGELNVISYEVLTGAVKSIMSKRVVKPLKLHFLGTPNPGEAHLVMSEGVTSNDDALAMTRIFSFRAEFDQLALRVLYKQIQIVNDSPFYDIQSVKLSDGNSLLFFQSSDSISIFAPVTNNCNVYYGLIQRLLTKGADKFLVFADNQKRSFYGHFLVLSKDCDQQNYHTIILKTRD